MGMLGAWLLGQQPMSGSLGSMRRWCPTLVYLRMAPYRRVHAITRDVVDDDIRQLAAAAAAAAIDADAAVHL